MTEMHKQLRRPELQRSVFSFAQTSPSDLVRSKLSPSEMQYRALAYLPDELLNHIPEDGNTYSLFQGFQATIPESPPGKRHRRRVSRGRKLLEEQHDEPGGSVTMAKLGKERDAVSHQLEMMGIRKNMASSEIREIDNKILNLTRMREIVLERLADLEQAEAVLEHDRTYVAGDAWIWD